VSNEKKEPEGFDEEELIRSEFDSIVSGLNLDQSAPSTYLDDLDLDTAREDGLTVIEWGGAESARLSDDRLEIDIDRTNDERVVTIRAIGSRWDGVEL